MDPKFLYMIVRQDLERLERDAARERMARQLGTNARPGAPRRVLGRLLVRAGMWLMVSHVAPAGSME